MSITAIISLLALGLTQLGVLVATVWKIATIVSQIGEMRRAHEEKLAQLNGQLDALDNIPTLIVRVGTIEGLMTSVPKHESRLAVLETQMQSQREMRRVAYPSKPDLGGE